MKITFERYKGVEYIVLETECPIPLDGQFTYYRIDQLADPEGRPFYAWTLDEVKWAIDTCLTNNFYHPLGYKLKLKKT